VQLELSDRSSRHNAYVVDEDVEAPPALQGLVDYASTVGLFCQVPYQGSAFAALILATAHSQLGRCGSLVDHCDLCSVMGKQARDRLTNIRHGAAHAGASDHGHFASQTGPSSTVEVGY